MSNGVSGGHPHRRRFARSTASCMYGEPSGTGSTHGRVSIDLDLPPLVEACPDVGGLDVVRDLEAVSPWVVGVVVVARVPLVTVARAHQRTVARSHPASLKAEHGRLRDRPRDLLARWVLAYRLKWVRTYKLSPEREDLMAGNAQGELVKYLTQAHAMEEQSIKLLEAGQSIAGDEEIARIYRAHLMQSQEHERYISERLQAYGESPSKLQDAAMKGGALGIGGLAVASPDTPVKLAAAAFAFENLEVASYKLLRSLAERAEDTETVSVVDRILEQEEAAAELVAGTFERALDVTLGEEPTSPVTSVTPIGKPSERPS